MFESVRNVHQMFGPPQTVLDIWVLFKTKWHQTNMSMDVPNRTKYQGSLAVEQVSAVQMKRVTGKGTEVCYQRSDF